MINILSFIESFLEIFVIENTESDTLRSFITTVIQSDLNKLQNIYETYFWIMTTLLVGIIISIIVFWVLNNRKMAKFNKDLEELRARIAKEFRLHEIDTDLGSLSDRIHELERASEVLNKKLDNFINSKAIKTENNIQSQAKINVNSISPSYEVQNDAQFEKSQINSNNEMLYFKSYIPKFGWSIEASLPYDDIEAYFQIRKKNDNYYFKLNDHPKPKQAVIENIDLTLSSICDILRYDKRNVNNIKTNEEGIMQLEEGVLKLVKKAIVQPE